MSPSTDTSLIFWLGLASSVLSGLVLLVVSATLRTVRDMRGDLQKHALKLVEVEGQLHAHEAVDDQHWQDYERRFREDKQDIQNLREWRHEVGDAAQLEVLRARYRRERESGGGPGQ